MNDVAGMLTVRGEERGKRRREERHRARERELSSFRDVIMSSVKKGNVSAPSRNETMLLLFSLSLSLFAVCLDDSGDKTPKRTFTSECFQSARDVTTACARKRGG